MRQKITGLFLLTVWLIQNCLSFLFFQYQRNECQKVSFKLAQSKYVNQKIYYFAYEDQDLIDWEKYGKEINREGVLYDVMAMELSDGKVLVKCFMDKKENKILHHFKVLSKQNTGGKTGNSFLKKIKNSKFFRLENDTQKSVLVLTKNPFNYPLDVKSIKAFKVIFKPPPEV